MDRPYNLKRRGGGGGEAMVFCWTKIYVNKFDEQKISVSDMNRFFSSESARFRRKKI